MGLITKKYNETHKDKSKHLSNKNPKTFLLNKSNSYSSCRFCFQDNN